MRFTFLLKNWKIELHSGIPVYKQIVNRVTTAMADGTLKHGDRLPTIRELNEYLNVNPNTVAKAYGELTIKGLIDGQRGAGSFVKLREPANTLSTKQKTTKLEELYHRMITEAQSYGMSEENILSFIHQNQKKKTI
jgi:GntR family transcriptional regulator